MEVLGKIGIPYYKKYFAVCPGCGTILEVDEDDLHRNSIAHVFCCTCPKCDSEIAETEMILKSIIDYDGKEVIKYNIEVLS